MKTYVKIAIVATVILVSVGIISLKKSRDDTPVAEPETVLAEGKMVPEDSLPQLIDLGAGKCIPCKMMAPILEELKEKYKETFQVVFYDVWENPDRAEQFGIRVIPTQIFLDASGKELFRHEGFFSKEDILSKWKELGVQ